MLSLIIIASVAIADDTPPSPPPIPASVPHAARLGPEESARVEAAFARLRANARQGSAPPGNFSLPVAPENVPAAPELSPQERESIADAFTRIAMAGITKFTSLVDEERLPPAQVTSTPALAEASSKPSPAQPAVRPTEMLHLDLEPLAPDSAVAAAIAATVPEEADLFRRVHAKYGELGQR